MPGFAGIKITQDAAAVVAFDDLHKIELRRNCDRILTDTPGLVASGSRQGGGNSGFQALNLVAQHGPRRIVLVGFDMRVDKGLHWHGRHPPGMNNPSERNMIGWRLAFDRAAADLAALGIEVVNASAVSTLSAFRFLSIEEALQWTK